MVSEVFSPSHGCVDYGSTVRQTEHCGGRNMWQKLLMVWWTGSRVKGKDWGPGVTFKVMPLVTYFLQLSLTPKDFSTSQKSPST
jgi:hypothetical protein